MESTRAGRRWRRAVLCVAVPLLVLVLGEALVRVLDLAPPRGLVTRIDDPQTGLTTLRCEGIEIDTPRVTRPFLADKPDGVLRIVLFGESAAAGYPFSPASTPARWLELRLRAMLPDRPLEVVDAAIPGINSEWMAALAREMLACEPDVFVVYAGNNEFLDPYVVRQARPFRSRIGHALRALALARFLERALRIEPLAGFSPPLRPSGIDEQRLGPVRERVLEAFRDNVASICTGARERGVDVLLVAPVVALRAFSPRGSTFSRELDAAARQTLRDRVARATAALRREDFAAASGLLTEAGAIDPDVALVEFRRGELLEAEGRPGAAAHYRRALELDQRPNRASRAIAAILEETARATGAAYFDMHAFFEKKAGDGVVGSDVVVDHCHLSVEAHYHVSTELLNALFRMKVAGLPAAWEAWQWRNDPGIPDGARALGIQSVLLVQPEIQIGFNAFVLALEQTDPELRAEELYRARTRFENVLRRDAGQARARVGRALVRIAEGKIPAARADLEQAREAEPEAVAELWASLERFPSVRELVETSGLAAE